MIRYRCPHCAALIVAHERRAGQSSVCKACVKPHPIPADQSLWLNERGEPLQSLAAPASVAIPVEPPTEHVTVSGEPVPEPPVPVPAPSPAPEPVAPAVVAFDTRSPSAPDFELPELSVEPAPVEPPAPISVPAAVAVREQVPPRFASVTAPVESASGPVRRSEPVTVATLTPPPEPAPAPERPVTRSVPQHFEAPERPEPVPAPERPVTRSHSFPAPVVTPAPRHTGRFTPTPVPARDSDSGYVEPVQLQTQADIAVALTAALTSRMKPPAAPRRDLRPSTAAWMLLTAVGVTLAVLALFTDSAYRWPALLVGAVQITAGYVWIVQLTKFRDPTRGLLCMIPPVTLFYLVQYKYAKFRPLRFVATGAALVAAAVVVPKLSPHTQALVHRADPPVVQPDPATMSKLEQLRAYRDQRSYDALSKQLELLAKTDPLLSADAKDRTELSAELRALCDHPDTGVKVRAMAAYARWDPAGARQVCLDAVRSPSADAREWALRLLPQWKDAESARAVQSLIDRPGTAETNRARAALEEIGGEPAQDAAIRLLNRADDNQSAKLIALSILEKVGSAETATWLRMVYAAAAADPAVRERALATADAIGARLRLPVSTP